MEPRAGSGKGDGGEIHPTAVVSPMARLGAGVAIGPYAYVGPEVTLGDGCRLHHHATVDGFTFLGEECEVFPHACIGLKTQDLKYKGGKPGLRAGGKNVFRECCTVHGATFDGEFTRIGEGNHFLAYSHVAHDCHVGDGVIMSNNATLAGHVVVEDHAIIGGLTAVHQFCRIGTRAMLGGCAKVEKDIPPFLIGDGNPAVVRGVNLIGLRRAGFDEGRVRLIKEAHRLIYRSGLNRIQAMERLASHPSAPSGEFQTFLRFMEISRRGLAPGPRQREEERAENGEGDAE